MTQAFDLLAQLRAAGFTLTARDNKLIVTPASRLTLDLTAAIREHKAALLELLADYEHPAGDVEALASYLERHPPVMTAELHEVEIVTWGGRTVALVPGEWEAFARAVSEYNAARDAEQVQRQEKTEQKRKMKRKPVESTMFGG